MPKMNKGGTIPEGKLYFKIGEVAKILNVKPHVLRYWETEFEQLKPEKGLTKQRSYSRSDVELLLLISTLLHEQRYTIEGARQVISKLKGNWASALEALKNNTLLPWGEKPEAKAQTDALRKENASLLKQLEKAKLELNDLKARLAKLNNELVTRQQRQASLFDTIRSELLSLRQAAEEDASTTNRPNLHSSPEND